jgi:hypothetical protein
MPSPGIIEIMASTFGGYFTGRPAHKMDVQMGTESEGCLPRARSGGLRTFLLLASVELGLCLQPVLSFLAGLTAALQVKFVCALPDLFLGRRCRILIHYKCSSSHCHFVLGTFIS